jgi:hypothetical protein
VQPRIAVIADEAQLTELKARLSGTGIECAAGEAAMIEAASRPCDRFVAAIVGAAGLKSTMAAVEAGNHLALANKESIVCAGSILLDAAQKARVSILPVDSEHSAIFQCLGDGRMLDHLTLTASGGPFRLSTLDEMARATPAQAAAHPKWSMGLKISIDSATLMNKALELIEAAIGLGNTRCNNGYLYGGTRELEEPMGPNATTYALPAEVFPSDIRAAGHGFAAGAAKLKSWVQDGGTLIGIQSAISWLKAQGIGYVEIRENKELEKPQGRRPYIQMDEDIASLETPGSIFEAEIDPTHPIGFGYRRGKLPVFRDYDLYLEPGKNPYSTPLVYTEDPLLSGYVNAKVIGQAKRSAGVVVSGAGSGKVIFMADDPNFRAHWFGTNKLFANAVFFGHTISGSSIERAPSK